MDDRERSDFDIQAEEIAASLHHVYEKYAPQFGWGLWENVPSEDRALMIAVIKKMIIDDIIRPGSLVINFSRRT